jgi:hypothetical protein
MSDADFLAALEACTLDPAAFKHAGHVRAAYLMLCDGDFTAASARFAAALRRFATHHGQPGRYHETITYAFLAVINERLQAGGDCDGWAGFAAANPDLLDARFLTHYYPTDVLASPLARRAFVLPGFSPVPHGRAPHP